MGDTSMSKKRNKRTRRDKPTPSKTALVQTPSTLAKTETHFHAPVIGQVHTGSGDVIVFSPNATSLEAIFLALREEVETNSPQEEKNEAQAKVSELERAIQKSPPDVEKISSIRTWFQNNVPKLAGSVTGVIVHPIIGKVVEAAGELAAQEFKRRFGA